MIISLDLFVVLWSVVLFVLVFYFTVGKVSTGRGTKFDAFSGGEELPPERAKYHSELFMYAALFVAFEVIGLLQARLQPPDCSGYSCLRWRWFLIVRSDGLVRWNRGC